jgi:hypothetical protein
MGFRQVDLNSVNKLDTLLFAIELFGYPPERLAVFRGGYRRLAKFARKVNIGLEVGTTVQEAVI